MDRVDVSRVMDDIRVRASAELRKRAVDRGNAPEFADAELFEIVERLLRSAVDDAADKVLLMPEILAGRPDLTLEPVARLTSHRPVIGPMILFAKRHVLQPLARWLYEYSMDNFERQARINRVLFAALQAIAVDAARLRLELDAIKRESGTRGSGAA
jgi:hypothetical protein